LHANLVFGARTVVRNDRLLTIAKRVGLGPYLLEILEQEMAAQSGDQKQAPVKKVEVTVSPSKLFESMSHTELRKVHLIRAIVFNPELLLMNRPIDTYEAHEASRVSSILREFVDLRGVDFNVEEAAVQRPHTVFMTSVEDRERAEAAADIADVVWSLTEEGVIIHNNQRPQLLSEGANPSRIVTSWQNEVETMHREIRILQQDIRSNEATKNDLECRKRELENTTRGLQDQLEITNQYLQYEQSVVAKENARTCKVRMCGGNLV
jgi:ABC-type Fe3+/spermidine/putrescine transport system ATPase subunit